VRDSLNTETVTAQRCMSRVKGYSITDTPHTILDRTIKNTRQLERLVTLYGRLAALCAKAPRLTNPSC